MPGPRTLYDKLWNAHVVREDERGAILYIDLHLVHEVTSPQAFEGLRLAGRRVRNPHQTLAVPDHNVPTTPDRLAFIADEDGRRQLDMLEANCREFSVPLIPMADARQGIVHIIGPELGYTQPGMTIVCGDSHTSTHGAFGALAFGIGTSDVEHVLATQTVRARKSLNMRVNAPGALPGYLSAKDLILATVGKLTAAGGIGHVIEYCGQAFTDLSMEGRMTVCNMSIEAGARAGLMAVDEKTIDYVRGRAEAPKGASFERAADHWRTLASDPDAHFDKEVEISVTDLAPYVTWGTSPEDALPITGKVPEPDSFADPAKKAAAWKSLQYMGLKPGMPIDLIKVDKVFIGSCTNGRIEDLRAAAGVLRGRRIATGIDVLVVPGSGLVKRQAEDEGLADIFRTAGAAWREPGCSMCLGMNPDVLRPGERCASTSNRNFVGRQGPGGRLIWSVQRWRPPLRLRDGSLTSASSCRSGPMEKFTTLTAVAAPLQMINIDTDVIIPARHLKTITREGLGKFAFYTLRFDETGAERPEFVLNQERYREAKILIAGANFGCGSSREHAPWALAGMGIRCVIAPSFADIFLANATKNGILCIALSQETVDKLGALAGSGNTIGGAFSVDLTAETVTAPDGSIANFKFDPSERQNLLLGLDDIELTLKHADEIAAFEARQMRDRGLSIARPVRMDVV